MDTTFFVAFLSYALAALLSMAFGVIYLVRSQCMPYHQDALCLSWQQLDQHLHVVSIRLMRAAGGGLLATGISTAVLALIAFRVGEPWAQYAIPAIGLVAALPSLYATILMRCRTLAHTAVAASAMAVGLLVLGFIFSLV